MVLLGVPLLISNPVATFCGEVIGKFIDNDTSPEATEEILESTYKSFMITGIFGGTQRIIPHYVSGKYLELSSFEMILKEISYTPRFLNENSFKTIFSNSFWDSVQTLITDIFF